MICMRKRFGSTRKSLDPGLRRDDVEERLGLPTSVQSQRRHPGAGRDPVPLP
jgi:hypothetical protein